MITDGAHLVSAEIQYPERVAVQLLREMADKVERMSEIAMG